MKPGAVVVLVFGIYCVYALVRKGPEPTFQSAPAAVQTTLPPSEWSSLPQAPAAAKNIPTAPVAHDVPPPAYVGGVFVGPMQQTYSTADDSTRALTRMEREEAKRQLGDAVYELQRSSQSLSNGGDWQGDLTTMRRRIRNAQDALDAADLAGVTGSGGVRYEIDRLHCNARRLEDEDWRSVVPDLQRGVRNAEDETGSLSTDDD